MFIGNRTYLEVASMVVTWWIVAFLRSECLYKFLRDETKQYVGNNNILHKTE